METCSTNPRREPRTKRGMQSPRTPLRTLTRPARTNGSGTAPGPRRGRGDAAEVAGLVRKPRGRDTPERRLAFESRVGAKARQLVARVVLPGEWYLVRWGGTRKGSGSFYTRPGLAVPTVQRTLRPLAWDPPAATDGTPNRDAPPASWTPKRPEEDPRAHRMRSRVRIRDLPPRRASIPHRFALCLAPAPRSDRARRRALPRAVARPPG